MRKYRWNMQTSKTNSEPETTKKQTKNDMLARLDKLEFFVKSLKEIGGDFPRLLKEAGIE